MGIVIGILIAMALAYLLGLENGVSTAGSVVCRWKGHRLTQGRPETKVDGFHAWLYCLRCGHSVTIINPPAGGLK